MVSHEASRTGAPRVAVDITRVLIAAGREVHVVLRWNGPLRSDFADAGARVTLEPLRRTRAALRLWRPTRHLAAVIEQLAAAIQIRRTRPEVVWCNTVLSACYVRPGIRLGKRVILHAHESLERIEQVLARYHLDQYWSSTTLLGCAPQACADLAVATRRPLGEVHCVLTVPDGDRVRNLARAALPRIPPDGLLIGAAGVVDRRKGVDLWLEMVAVIAMETADLDPHFIWVGGDSPADFDLWASRTGLGNRVTFTGSLVNPYPWITALEVFTLTSRWESFPLVVLEAMTLGVPVVAFAVGDVPHQIGKAGRLVSEQDPLAAANQVISLLRDPAARLSLGAAAAERVRDCFPWTDFAAAVNQVACGTRG